MIRFLAIILGASAIATSSLADPAQVDAVDLDLRGQAWTVSVTISHPDTGWDDYADGWRIETVDGTVLGTRVLHHPHVEEQPFTRALGGVAIDDSVGQIVIRTRTNVTGWADETTAPIPVPTVE